MGLLALAAAPAAVTGCSGSPEPETVGTRVSLAVRKGGAGDPVVMVVERMKIKA